MTGYVYRCYDTDGELIYVGSTANVAKRMSVHRAHRTSRASAWLRACMARHEVIECVDMDAARVLERRMIAELQPVFNSYERRAPMWMTRRRVAEYLVDRGHVSLAAETACCCKSANPDADLPAVLCEAHQVIALARAS
jgi:predicted GIY-YIG superfamily endonuclease